MVATWSIAALFNVLLHTLFLLLPFRVIIQPCRREVDNLKFWQAISYFVCIFGPDDGFTLVSYRLSTFLTHATLDLFATSTLALVNDQLVEVWLCLKAIAQFAAVQVE